MNGAPRRNRLMPWYIGLVLILAAVIYTGYQMFFVVECAVPTAIALGPLVIIPIIYLVLMYMTLTSQP